MAVRRVVLDTETTGLYHEGGDRMIEVACVELDDTLMTGKTYQTYINPGRRIDAGAAKVHGITEVFLEGKPEFPEIVGPLMDFIANDEIIAHNSAFDVGFLNMELGHIGRDPVSNPITCTWKMAKTLRPGKRNSLDGLAAAFKIKTTRDAGLHGALQDAILLAKVYSHLRAMTPSGDLDLKQAAEIHDMVELPAVILRDNTPEELELHRKWCAAVGVKPF
jgi:DNA polymerase III subunit epsilon